MSSNTYRTYRGHIANFEAWLAQQELAVLDVSLDDLNRYSLHVHQQNLADVTMGARFITLRSFYRWAYQTGRSDHNPAAEFSPRYTKKDVSGDVLSLDDLRALVAAAGSAMDRAVLLLHIVLGLGPAEMIDARISDVINKDGAYYFRLGAKLVPLPTLVADVVVELIGERRRGPLMTNRRGDQMDRASVRRIFVRCGNVARLGVTVNPKLVQASVRTILINEPISTVAVLQGLSFGAYNDLLARSRLQPPAPQHVAHRLALLLRPDADGTEALLDHADGLTNHHGLPQSARVMLAGAAFERHLRLLGIRQGALPPDTERTQIASLTGILIGAHVIKKTDEKLCVGIGTVRDWAAHGWFEKVTRDVGDRVVADIKRMVAAYPVSN